MRFAQNSYRRLPSIAAVRTAPSQGTLHPVARAGQQWAACLLIATFLVMALFG
jgi:hypothetical protein